MWIREGTNVASTFIVTDCMAYVERVTVTMSLNLFWVASGTLVITSLMLTLTNISGRIKELRLLVLKLRHTLEDLLKIVCGNWAKSRLA